MNLTEAQELVLKECEREKKIALRNLILVIALVVIVITLLAVFALTLLPYNAHSHYLYPC